MNTFLRAEEAHTQQKRRERLFRERQEETKTHTQREKSVVFKSEYCFLSIHLTQQHATERSFVFPFYPKYDDDENAFVHVADHLYYRTISKLS